MTEPPSPPPYRTGRVEYSGSDPKGARARVAVGKSPNREGKRFRVIDDTVRGSLRRLGLGAFALVVLILGVVLVGTVAASLMRMSVPDLPRLTEATNSSTGLADGTYVLVPTSMLIASDGCAFTGVLESQEISREIVIVGQGLAECGLPNEGDTRSVPPSANRVEFVVRNGTAQISRLESTTEEPS